MSSLIFVLFSIVFFLAVWLIGKNIGVQLNRHWPSYIISLLVVSLPALILSAVFGVSNLFQLTNSGKSFGLPISLLVMVVLLPFVGIFLWGIAKKLISDSSVPRLLPPIAYGIVLAVSIYLLTTANNIYLIVASIISIVSIIILFFSTLSFLRRFWFFQILLGLLALFINLVTVPFGYTLENDSILNFKFGLINLEWLMIFYGFMNIFLAVFYWLDNKLPGAFIKSDSTKSKNSDEIKEELETKKVNQAVSKTSDKSTEVKVESTESNIAEASTATYQTSDNTALTYASENNQNTQRNPENINKVNEESRNLNSSRALINTVNSSQARQSRQQTTNHQTNLASANQADLRQAETKNEESQNRSKNIANSQSSSTDNNALINNGAQVESMAINSTVVNKTVNSSKIKSIIPKVDIKHRLEKLYAARALARKSQEAINPDFKMPNFSSKSKSIDNLNLDSNPNKIKSQVSSKLNQKVDESKIKYSNNAQSFTKNTKKNNSSTSTSDVGLNPKSTQQDSLRSERDKVSLSGSSKLVSDQKVTKVDQAIASVQSPSNALNKGSNLSSLNTKLQRAIGPLE